MDIDILITIGVIAFVLLRAYGKSKKKKHSPFPQPTVESEPIWETIEDEYGDGEVKNQTSYEEIPKNEEYFTYENLEPEMNDEKRTAGSSSIQDVEMNVQNIERESENLPQFSFDKEELMKGVIYSEILKRPYN